PPTHTHSILHNHPPRRLTPPLYFLMRQPPPSSPLFPYTTLFRSRIMRAYMPKVGNLGLDMMTRTCTVQVNLDFENEADMVRKFRDRKSTRLNSSHVKISYAVFCLKKKKQKHIEPQQTHQTAVQQR